MRFATPALTGALRAANPTYRMATQHVRTFATEAAPKKKGNTGLWLALFAGVAGGIAYNQTKTTVQTPVVAQENRPLAFNPKEFVSLKLKQVTPITHDTAVYRFDLPEGHTGNLPVASCVIVKHQPAEGKPIIRPYTPTSPQESVGYVEFVIKKYDTGKLTPEIASMKPGDSLDFKGPIVKYNWDEKPKAHVGMVAGGTGITPMLQVIRRVFAEGSEDKKTKISLIFGNQTENDILLKEELDNFAKQHPDRFKVVYALDKAPEGWTGVTGYVTSEVVKAHLPSAEEEDSVIFVCGPPPMVKSIAGPKNKMEQGELDGILKELGYTKEKVFKF